MIEDDLYDSRLKPYLISILVHGFLLVGLMLIYKTKPLPTVIATEASLVGQEDLAQIQAQIAQAHKALNSPAPAQKTPTTSPKSKMSDYDKQMAERERVYQEQMKQYADDLDRQIESELQLQRQALDELDRERQREVNQLKSRERSNDEIARENSKSLNEARERQKQNEPKPDKATGKSLGEGQSTQSTNNAKSANTTQGSSVSRGNSNQAKSSIASRVQAIWERYDNPKNRHLIATITIDDQGNLQSVRFGAGDKELQPSLESSIKEASPFPEMKGISNTFTIRFFTD